MKPLNDKQKQLIFDYAFDLTNESQTTEASQLVSANPEAKSIYEAIKSTLNPLDNLQADLCPDHLTERTILRLKNTARSSQQDLEHLLTAEQARTAAPKTRLWRNFGELIATAAVILFVGSAMMAPLNHARQKSWQAACQLQLKRIWQGTQAYSTDNDNKLPAVATAAGAPWWKVGYQGNENHSNTRNTWLLAKKGYVNPADFVCPARRQGKAIQFDSARAVDYNDFPTRKYITYSTRIKCSKNGRPLRGRIVMLSDMNPLFESLPQDFATPLRIQLEGTLKNLNSLNHNRRGQNVLFSNGSAIFIKKRYVDISQDDIFTLQNTTVYQGTEVPSCNSDAFLAP